MLRCSLLAASSRDQNALCNIYYYSVAACTHAQCAHIELIVSRCVCAHNKQAVDYHVVRYPGAVSWFAPGSYASRPPLQTCIPNLVCAGDWVSVTATLLIHSIMQFISKLNARSHVA
jgi:hypothetical protein